MSETIRDRDVDLDLKLGSYWVNVNLLWSTRTNYLVHRGDRRSYNLALLTLQYGWQKYKPRKISIFNLLNAEKQMVLCKSTADEVSFE